MSELLHQLIRRSAEHHGDRPALGFGNRHVLTYAELEEQVENAAQGFCALGLTRGQRVAIWLDKRIETVVAMFAASRAGAVFVPINPVLKERQVVHILSDSGSAMLITSEDRLDRLSESLAEVPDLAHVILTGSQASQQPQLAPRITSWQAVLAGDHKPTHRHIDVDIASILYTSGSTGRPKGVVLSHRNMVAGAHSVAEYLRNTENDRILAALPLSFDAGLSQLTTAFHRGAFVQLHNYLLARDVPRAIERHKITGLGAVPPVWIPLSRLEWPAGAVDSLRYITNTGGAMPLTTLAALRERLPGTLVYLMYGLTEAFRSTYLPPDQLEQRPDSIGKAIPNAEILVLREDGTPCGADEPGELVHRGALVAQGYWNDPEKTAERFRPVPGVVDGLVNDEIAVWSGDSVRQDNDGYLYFVGRRDEMMKTSGYRVSPTEVEEALYQTGLIAEAVAFGKPHDELGQSILVVVVPVDPARFTVEELLEQCRQSMPTFMVPHDVVVQNDSLPRNPNGKIDRPGLRTQHVPT